jgi:hypothetical protein
MNKQDKADHAFDLYREILNTIPEETLRVFKLGHLFKRIRDEKLYKCLDSECDNFGQFCADPNVGYQRATIYAYIEVWEKYIEELRLNMDTLREIAYTRLRKIISVVSKDPDEWLSRARSWSDKDLINEIRKERGRPPMKPVEEIDTSKKHVDYQSYARDHGCIHHRDRTPELAHFPQTEKMGGVHQIPLCHDCHIGELHKIGVDSYLSLYKNQIFDYLFNLIDELYEELNATK